MSYFLARIQRFLFDICDQSIACMSTLSLICVVVAFVVLILLATACSAFFDVD